MGRVLAMLATILFARAAAAQISPGPLARPHATLEGATQCTRCHPVGRKDAMDGACLACHREITRLLGQRRGLHATEGRVRCASCHPDHAGAGFDLVSWSPDSTARFDHRRAGWALEGAHDKAKCADCHAAKRVSPEFARLPPGGRAGRWTGLSTACLSCHDDAHRGGLDRACETCHDVRRWVPAGGFSHDSTRYALTGRHRDVTCEACHGARPLQAPGASRMDVTFRPLRGTECSGCHRDPHAGRLGVGCSQCHVTIGFADRRAGGFDHSRTRYPLRGKHAAVRCAGCHDRGRATPPFATCSACHADAHAATAALTARTSDCATCHDERGFRPSVFTAEQHRGGRCTSCHVDAHPGELGRLAGECAACHAIEAWSTPAMPAARHAEFRFALEGRHAAAACGSCHRVGALIVFRLEQRDCVSCHVDPHERPGAPCASCHSTTTFHPSTVNAAAHESFRFPLEAAHRAVACNECHRNFPPAPSGPALVSARAATPTIRLDEGRLTCMACHQDPHAGQFAGARPKACDACHDLAAFRPAGRFDHRRDTTFPLTGGHEQVACARCHPDGRWRGTPAKCEACHR